MVHDAFEMTVCAFGSYDAVVHAEADHDVGVAATGAEMTTRFAPPFEVRGGLLARGEEAGRLDHDVDAVSPHGISDGLLLLELLDQRCRRSRSRRRLP